MTRETFTPDWLALREPVDHRSRSELALASLRDWWRAGRASRVVDLGSGTGSNLRYLAPRLAGDERPSEDSAPFSSRAVGQMRAQAWTLVDHDPSLIARARAAGLARVPGVARVDLVCGDLAREGIEVVAGADLVTASALLDLVSQTWLDRLVEACRSARAAAFFALTWNGAIEWSPHGDPDDELVADAVRAHQRGDKGTGPALGQTAGAGAERAFIHAGYRTQLAPSPWVLGPNERSLVIALIEGWARATEELRPTHAARARAWADRRGQIARSDRFRVVVSHSDLLALPPE